MTYLDRRIETLPAFGIFKVLEEIEMNILNLSQIWDRLKIKYESQARRFPENFSNLIPSSATAGQELDINSTVTKLTGLPTEGIFGDVPKLWDLGNLTFAGFRFAIGGDYAKNLVDMNTLPGTGWWADRDAEGRPAELLMIAQSDPYILLLDARDGKALAYTSTMGSGRAEVIANDFESLLCVLGSVELLSQEINPDSLLQDLLAYLGGGISAKFWRDQVDHWSDAS